jgi:soluble lytic murein transglycosylase-like protein
VRPTNSLTSPPAVLPVPPPAHAPEPIVRFVNLVAPEYKLQPHLVLSVIATESNFDASAVSPKDAHGLMQLIPGTAARFGVRNIKDPVQNIRGGMAYLRWLMARFEGDLRLVAAAYNAGEGAVERYLGVPPYAETRLYVLKIRAGVAGQTHHPFDPTAAEPSPVLPLIRSALVNAGGGAPTFKR